MPAKVSGNRIERVTGRGGLPLVRLSHDSGYATVVSEYGAHVLSWSDPSERELLFVSDQARYERGKPIRGGIPVVFPQFSKGVLPAHGFARTMMWKVVREQVSTAGPVAVTLRLLPNAGTREIWPYEFCLELDVVLTEVLLLTMRVENTGRAPFQFNSALHTYFRTQHVLGLRVQGFFGCEYVDLLREKKRDVEGRHEVLIDGPIDRMYRDSPRSVQVYSDLDRYAYLITKEGFSDTVVWNPWVDGAKALADLGDAEYSQMVCVESGNVLTSITLAPGELHTSSQVLRIEGM
jgi:glucose-6-phosphate 1-epimerase